MKKGMRLKSVAGLSFVEVVLGLTLLLIVFGIGYTAVQAIGRSQSAELLQQKSNETVDGIINQLYDMAGNSLWFDSAEATDTYYPIYAPRPISNNPNDTTDPYFRHLKLIEADASLDPPFKKFTSNTSSEWLNSKFRVKVDVSDIKLPENSRGITITLQYKRKDSSDDFHEIVKKFDLSPTRYTHFGNELKLRVINGRKYEQYGIIEGAPGILFQSDNGIGNTRVRATSDNNGYIVAHGLDELVTFTLDGRFKEQPLYYNRSANPADKYTDSKFLYTHPYTIDFSDDNLDPSKYARTDTSITIKDNIIMFPFGRIRGRVHASDTSSGVSNYNVIIVPVRQHVHYKFNELIQQTTNWLGEYSAYVMPGKYFVAFAGSDNIHSGSSKYAALAGPSEYKRMADRRAKNGDGNTSNDDSCSPCMEVIEGETYDYNSNNNRELSSHAQAPPIGNVFVRVKKAEWDAVNNRYDFATWPTAHAGTGVALERNVAITYDLTATPTPSPFVPVTYPKKTYNPYEPKTHYGYAWDKNHLGNKDIIQLSGALNVIGFTNFYSKAVPIRDRLKSLSTITNPSFINDVSQIKVYPNGIGPIAPVFVGNHDGGNGQVYVTYTGGGAGIGNPAPYAVLPSQLVFTDLGTSYDIATQLTGYDDLDSSSTNGYIFSTQSWGRNTGVNIDHFAALQYEDLATVKGRIFSSSGAWAGGNANVYTFGINASNEFTYRLNAATYDDSGDHVFDFSVGPNPEDHRILPSIPARGSEQGNRRYLIFEHIVAATPLNKPVLLQSVVYTKLYIGSGYELIASEIPNGYNIIGKDSGGSTLWTGQINGSSGASYSSPNRWAHTLSSDQSMPREQVTIGTPDMGTLSGLNKAGDDLVATSQINTRISGNGLILYPGDKLDVDILAGASDINFKNIFISLENTASIHGRQSPLGVTAKFCNSTADPGCSEYTGYSGVPGSGGFYAAQNILEGYKHVFPDTIEVWVLEDSEGDGTADMLDGATIKLYYSDWETLNGSGSRWVYAGNAYDKLSGDSGTPGLSEWNTSSDDVGFDSMEGDNIRADITPPAGYSLEPASIQVEAGDNHRAFLYIVLQPPSTGQGTDPDDDEVGF